MVGAAVVGANVVGFAVVGAAVVGVAVGAAVVGAAVVGVAVGTAAVVAHVDVNTTPPVLLIDCTLLESVVRVAVLLGTYSSCVPDTDDDVDSVCGSITVDAGEYSDDPTTTRMLDIAPVSVMDGVSPQYPIVVLVQA